MTSSLMHEGNEVREFYAQLPRPVLVGIEATGSMHWFLNVTLCYLQPRALSPA